jgi:ribonuclease-3
VEPTLVPENAGTGEEVPLTPDDARPAAEPSDTPLAAALTATLGRPLTPRLLVQALTHRSYAYENGGLPTNERLEFLGDSVLGLIITDTLFHAHPDLPEGQLAKLRAAVVNAKALADVGRGLGLGAALSLGKGEEATGGRDKSSILADTVEALIGAVYLDQGLPAAALVVHTWFDPLVAQAATLGAGLDWKTSLQELTATLGLGVPEYAVSESGPDHAKTFRAHVVLASGTWGDGTGSSKKEAEQEAAASSWRELTRAYADQLRSAR